MRGDVTIYRLNWLAAASVVLLGANAADAQDAPLLSRPTEAPVPPDTPAATPLGQDEVGFSANDLFYDTDGNTVTASGDVRMTRTGYRLRADRVKWNRASGAVRAEGNVAITSPEGDTAYGDSIDLTDTLRDGVVENLLVVLEDGGRIAARHGARSNGIVTLDHAAYSPCPVVGEDGCPKEPVWKVTAVKVTYDPARHRISYRGATIHLFGMPVVALPGLSHPDGSGGGSSGLLMPDLRYSRTNGFELAAPVYLRLAADRDLTLTPHVYSKVLPAFEGRYRQLTEAGAFQIGGFATYGTRRSTSTANKSERDFRGYFDANGRFQLDPFWSVTASIRRTTDRTFLRRYNISDDDRLRSLVQAERIDDSSYLSIAGWSFQGLRSTDRPGETPIVFPEIDYRKRIAGPIVGGRIALQLNSLSLVRTSGQDTQRAFAGARWDVHWITPFGQELTLTGYVRGDVYHSDEAQSTATVAYRGQNGWNTRAIAAAAADLRWPFVGEFLGGTQRITPRVQIVASPPTRNLQMPNEDARSIELEDSNLFALNRFSGYDRWEDSTRITYGGEYALDLPRFSLRTTIGQSYRLTRKPSLFPAGTGLTRRNSDIVGRTTLKYGRFLTVTNRFRLDKNSLALRRNELDATVGSSQTYLSLGYLRLNRDIAPSIEDLRDREEIRLGARIRLARHWSVFGSTIIDLTGRSEDPLSIADGYEPVRHRVSLSYEDDCFQFGLSWRRAYEQNGDARRGNTFQLRLALRNLGG